MGALKVTPAPPLRNHIRKLPHQCTFPFAQGLWRRTPTQALSQAALRQLIRKSIYTLRAVLRQASLQSSATANPTAAIAQVLLKSSWTDGQSASHNTAARRAHGHWITNDLPPKHRVLPGWRPIGIDNQRPAIQPVSSN